jgi:hypothetical protein
MSGLPNITRKHWPCWPEPILCQNSPIFLSHQSSHTSFRFRVVTTIVDSSYHKLNKQACSEIFMVQGSKFTFFPARTVRSDHVAAVAFRKIRSHFIPPFFPPSSTLTDITKYHAKLIGWHATTNTGQWGWNLKEYWQCWHCRHEHMRLLVETPDLPLAIHTAFTLYSGVKNLRI